MAQPVLTGFVPSGGMQPVAEGFGMVDGIFGARRKQIQQDEELAYIRKQREIMQPAMEAEASYKAATALAGLRDLERNTTRKTNAVAKLQEAKDRFDWLVGVSIEPNEDGVTFEDAAIAWKSEYGEFAGTDPAFEQMNQHIDRKLATLDQAKMYSVKQIADETAKLRVVQQRLDASESLLKKTVPGFAWNKPIPIEGNPGKALVYRPTADGNYTATQVDMRDRNPSYDPVGEPQERGDFYWDAASRTWKPKRAPNFMDMLMSQAMEQMTGGGPATPTGRQSIPGGTADQMINQSGQALQQPATPQFERQPSDEAVEALMADPSLADQFDEFYGPGASEFYLGG